MCRVALFDGILVLATVNELVGSEGVQQSAAITCTVTLGMRTRK